MKSQKKIEAVVEIQPFDVDPPWPVASADCSFLRLFSGSTLEEIGSVVLTACSYNHELQSHSSPMEFLESLVADEFVLPGGLRFSENEAVKVVPGCCSGLEDWREWLDVPNGNSVWAGHDPTPGVEFINGYVRVWQDEILADTNFIDFGIEELRGHLIQVEADLKGFTVSLGKWTELLAPTLRESLVNHFILNMNIVG